jgi:hypothetical protein
LKSGKTKDVLKQLRLYRRFGCPTPTLLEMFICEYGFGSRNTFPPEAADQSIREKLAVLSEEQFGYEILPFEFAKEGEEDTDSVAFFRPMTMWNPQSPSAIRLLHPARTQPNQPFLNLCKMVNVFVDLGSQTRRVQGHVRVVVYCTNCKRFILLGSKSNCECYVCGSDMTAH